MPSRRRTADPGDEPYLKVLRPLVEAYFAFIRKDDRHIRALGLTSAQFDVIATLGDTPGMTCRELSEQTLVTKGTLTGVLDRLEAKGLTERVPGREDRRCVFIRLTAKGEETFKKVFPAHVYHIKPYFERALAPPQMKQLRNLLLRLKESFERER
ncbi:MAG TPA: MarR family transcriptional regulator [Candidatus Manganitrophaceae bacterium]|nr:MarR family transcriptional regulator [Candidatus Manganitrophaceae bacterium]